MKTWLIEWLGTELGVAPSTIDPAQTFLNFGLNSVQAMTMVGDLETKLGVRLSPTLAWDYPSIETLSAHLDDRITQTPETKAPAAPAAIRPDSSASDAAALLAELDMLSDQDVDSLLSQYLGESK